MKAFLNILDGERHVVGFKQAKARQYDHFNPICAIFKNIYGAPNGLENVSTAQSPSAKNVAGVLRCKHISTK